MSAQSTRPLGGAATRARLADPTTQAPMLIQEVRHPKGLDAWAAARVATLRDAHGMSFPDIAAKVRNVSGGEPTARTCANAYWALKANRRRPPPRYEKCGRRAG